MCGRTFVLALLLILTSMPNLMAQQPSLQPSIARMSTAALLSCAANNTCNDSDWDIADELRHRLSVRRLVAIYPQQNASLKAILIDALYTAKGPKVEALMRDAAFSNLKPGRTDEDNHYFPLQYLAKLCDQRALKELNRTENYKDSYPVSCIQWQTTLATFGKCGYKPAIPLLAGSLNSACLDNTVAADRSLRQLMPNSKCRKKAALRDDFQAEADCYVKDAGAAKHP